MRDVTIQTWIGEIRRQLDAIAYHMQLVSSGNALFEETLKALLIKKGIITEEEFKVELGEQIKKINDREAEEAKKDAEKAKTELATPTPAEVSKIEETKVE